MAIIAIGTIAAIEAHQVAELAFPGLMARYTYDNGERYDHSSPSSLTSTSNFPQGQKLNLRVLGRVAAAMRDAGIDQSEIDDYSSAPWRPTTTICCA